MITMTPISSPAPVAPSMAERIDARRRAAELAALDRYRALVRDVADGGELDDETAAEIVSRALKSSQQFADDVALHRRRKLLAANAARRPELARKRNEARNALSAIQAEHSRVVGEINVRYSAAAQVDRDAEAALLSCIRDSEELARTAAPEVREAFHEVERELAMKKLEFSAVRSRAENLRNAVTAMVRESETSALGDVWAAKAKTGRVELAEAEKRVAELDAERLVLEKKLEERRLAMEVV